MVCARASFRHARLDPGAASQLIVNFSDEKAQEEGINAGKVVAETATPAASMIAHLDNIAMHKRAPVQQAIAHPQEKALSEVVHAKYNTDFYVIDKYPGTARPFYAKIDDAGAMVRDNVSVSNAFDFPVRGQEVLPGGQRIHDPAELEVRPRAKDVDPESAGIKEYLATFRQVGVSPHGGGDIGLDRVVAGFLALTSVHLAAYHPRPQRLLPKKDPRRASIFGGPKHISLLPIVQGVGAFGR
ncbi:aspartyl-tRNA synthetase [Colletotrichum truncatum]|uniref:Aspartyl-tRNA synthetase n=1 Tax=Colletotrichum truncatum TaxID=5467 RepID=A0ACC3YUK2_COLTU|nr:aspartyl-tRNA synthetase [Colletotrichum truncatum]KAF6785805.1 aspartyl-tRNA synthetase [Colletotrichum truncatum]